MASRKLSPEQENWLYLNYPKMTNNELASYLAEWIRKDNQKQIERLRFLLNEDFGDGGRKVIERKIQALEKFKGISISLIKRYARELHCCPKTREHIIECNQKKARATNLKRWQDKAEKVEHVAEWLRSFEEKDDRFCIIDDKNHLKAMQVSINRFNQYEGFDKRVYLSANFIPEISLLRVRGSLYRTTR